ncbi:hypothetical protein GGX14DRAFT_629861 [Mycena pura]|uniref:Uncharacterized protein n=1 Tax=Mycena pura TaxID=153505 RepID=A0AAD7E433_9AGAR|nr:hypothetical protein GGX14DRAFT_629861 [Mycena pura]
MALKTFLSSPILAMLANLRHATVLVAIPVAGTAALIIGISSLVLLTYAGETPADPPYARRWAHCVVLPLAAGAHCVVLPLAVEAHSPWRPTAWCFF